jgi:hypothetical protein
MSSADSNLRLIRHVLTARQKLGKWQLDLGVCVEQLCSTSKLRDLKRRLPRMDDILMHCLASAKVARSCRASLDDAGYSRVLQQLLTAYCHAMHLVKKQSEEQAASDLLLTTAERIKDIGLAADYTIATASNAQPARRQLVVTCVGESGVSCVCTLPVSGLTSGCGHSWHSVSVSRIVVTSAINDCYNAVAVLVPNAAVRCYSYPCMHA